MVTFETPASGCRDGPPIKPETDRGMLLPLLSDPLADAAELGGPLDAVDATLSRLLVSVSEKRTEDRLLAGRAGSGSDPWERVSDGDNRFADPACSLGVSKSSVSSPVVGSEVAPLVVEYDDVRLAWVLPEAAFLLASGRVDCGGGMDKLARSA
jgi:hypothetical protein